MRGAHTPGPWSWSATAFDRGLTGAGPVPVIEDLGYDGLWIDRDSPNARLIAAAPDLLEALQATTDLLASANRSSDRPSGYISNRIMEARAAIAKATGEQS